MITKTDVSISCRHMKTKVNVTNKLQISDWQTAAFVQGSFHRLCQKLGWKLLLHISWIFFHTKTRKSK